MIETLIKSRSMRISIAMLNVMQEYEIVLDKIKIYE